MSSESKLQEWMEALAGEGIDREALCNLEAELIGKVGRLRVLRDRAIRDMEAARLLPLGAEVVTVRQGCHRSTAYRRASRAKEVARHSHNATPA